VNNLELAQALIQLGQSIELEEEEINAMLPHRGEEDRSFYIPNTPPNFYVPTEMRSLTDPKNLRRL